MYKTVKSRTSRNTELVQTIAVPRFHKPQRIPSFPSLERTSVLAFTDTFTTYTEPNPGEETFFAIIRDPVFPLWKVVSSSLPHSAYRPMDVNMQTAVNKNLMFVPTFANTLLTYPLANFVSPALPLYVYQGKEYIPCLNAQAAVQARFSGDPGGCALAVNISYITIGFDVLEYTFNGVTTPGTSGGSYYQSLIGTIPDTAIAVSFDLIDMATSIAGVFLESLYCGSTTSASGSVFPLTAPTASVSVWAMLPLTSAPEFGAAPVVWQSTRANAVGVLFSNVSAVMQKEGTVNAARVPSETGVNMFSFRDWNTQFARVHPKERYFGPLEKGLYSFTLPDSTSELYHEYDNIGYPTAAFRHYLDGNRYAHCIVMQDPDHISGLAVTVDRHIEFKSNSVLFPYGFASTPLENYHQAQMALANLGVFYENPLHLASIAALAKQALVKYGPRLLSAGMPYVVQGANKLLTAVNNKLGTMAQAGFAQPKTKTQRNRPSQQKTRPRRQQKPKRR